jgi:hypothetical protein
LTEFLKKCLEKNEAEIESKKAQLDKMINSIRTRCLRQVILTELIPIIHFEELKKHQAKRGKKTRIPISIVSEKLSVNRRTAWEYVKTIEALDLVEEFARASCQGSSV